MRSASLMSKKYLEKKTVGRTKPPMGKYALLVGLAEQLGYRSAFTLRVPPLFDFSYNEVNSASDKMYDL